MNVTKVSLHAVPEVRTDPQPVRGAQTDGSTRGREYAVVLVTAGTAHGGDGNVDGPRGSRRCSRAAGGSRRSATGGGADLCRARERPHRHRQRLLAVDGQGDPPPGPDAADASEPRPTLYLLNGSGGGQGIATWEKQTDVENFFSDKNINVVTPLLGGYSYYTDWRNDDPALGRNMWTTFLTHELPPVIDREFGTSGRNAIAGLSMSGTSVLGLATTAPELYEAVGAYSGCAETSTPLGQSYVQAVVRVKGGDPENMWGPVGDPAWIENDPYLQAEKLRGIDLYISSGSGLPGQYERLGSRSVNNDPIGLVGQVVVGGSIEAAVHHCTRRMAQRLEELDIPARIDLRPAGTHSWDYWEDDLRNSWPLLSQAVGL